MKKPNLQKAGITLGLFLLLYAIFFLLVNIMTNYLFLAIISLKQSLAFDLAHPSDVSFAFKLRYLFQPPASFGYATNLIFAGIATITIGRGIILKVRDRFGTDSDIEGSARFATQKEYSNGLYMIDAQHLDQAEHSGIPLATDITQVKREVIDNQERITKTNLKRYWIDIRTVNSLIVGTTRSGKGEMFVLNMMQVISTSKDKRHLIVNDPKGELYEYMCQHLKNNGYTVWCLNLRDPVSSDPWNPLNQICQDFIDAKNQTIPDYSKVSSQIGELAHFLTADSTSQPIWPQSAAALLEAIIFYLLEDAYKNDNMQYVNMYSVYNFLITYGAASISIPDQKQPVNALSYMFDQLPVGHPAKMSYSTSRFAEGEMRSSIFATLASNLKLFADTGIAQMTSHHAINIDQMREKDNPVAVFMVIPDEQFSRHQLASLFVDQSYARLIHWADQSPNKQLPRCVEYILDEFGNMPTIPKIATKLTVTLGRNIIFNLMIQSLDQLKAKYDKHAGSIQEACGNQIYINSSFLTTNEHYSRLLGTSTRRYNTTSGQIGDLFAKSKSSHYKAEPLMRPDDLRGLPFGRIVVMRQRQHPILTDFEPYSLHPPCPRQAYDILKGQGTYIDPTTYLYPHLSADRLQHDIIIYYLDRIESEDLYKTMLHYLLVETGISTSDPDIVRVATETYRNRVRSETLDAFLSWLHDRTQRSTDQPVQAVKEIKQEVKTVTTTITMAAPNEIYEKPPKIDRFIICHFNATGASDQDEILYMQLADQTGEAFFERFFTNRFISDWSENALSADVRPSNVLGEEHFDDYADLITGLFDQAACILTHDRRALKAIFSRLGWKPDNRMIDVVFECQLLHAPDKTAIWSTEDCCRIYGISTKLPIADRLIAIYQAFFHDAKRDDRNHMLKQVSINGLALRLASDRLRKDQGVITRAVAENPRAKHFAK